MRVFVCVSARVFACVHAYVFLFNIYIKCLMGHSPVTADWKVCSVRRSSARKQVVMRAAANQARRILKIWL